LLFFLKVKEEEKNEYVMMTFFFLIVASGDGVQVFFQTARVEEIFSSPYAHLSVILI
jgi:hypothetical protein